VSIRIKIYTKRTHTEVALHVTDNSDMVQADKQLFIKVTASNTRQMFHDEMT